jgi:hypothetical protein
MLPADSWSLAVRRLRGSSPETTRAHRWRRRIESGQAKSITDLAEQESVTVAYFCRLLSLTCSRPTLWKRFWTDGSQGG